MSTPAAPVGSSAHRVQYLDGIRALAILAVVSVHWVHPYLPFFPGGYIGVDVFFVLSGFLITTILWRGTGTGSVPARYGTFLKRRVRRLYPALLGLLVIATLAMTVLNFPQTAARAAGDGLLASVQAGTFVKGLDLGQMVMFGHTWSLSVEWIFYLLWPLGLLWARSRGVSAGRLAVIALSVGALLYLAALPGSGEWFYYGPLARSGQLLVGCAAALWMLSAKPPKFAVAPWLRTVILLAALAALLLWVLLGSQEKQLPYRFIGFPLVTLASTALVVLGSLWQGNRVIGLLGIAPLALLGRVSYSLYLWHLIPIQLLSKDRIDLPMPVLALLGVALAVALTALSYRFLEVPFLRAPSPRGGARPSDPAPLTGPAVDARPSASPTRAGVPVSSDGANG